MLESSSPSVWRLRRRARRRFLDLSRAEAAELQALVFVCTSRAEQDAPGPNRSIKNYFTDDWRKQLSLEGGSACGSVKKNNRELELERLCNRAVGRRFSCVSWCVLYVSARLRVRVCRGREVSVRVARLHQFVARLIFGVPGLRRIYTCRPRPRQQGARRRDLALALRAQGGRDAGALAGLRQPRGQATFLLLRAY